MKKKEKHGLVGTREYRAWSDMLTRCRNSKFIKWKDYGGRGIKVCQRWQDSFLAFLEDVGKCPEKHSLDREDSNKDYEPGNCKWSTQAEQMRNTRRNRLLEHNGKIQCLTDWAIECGSTFAAFYHRIERGWTIEEVITGSRLHDPEIIEFQGKAQSITAWSKDTGIPAPTIRSRIGRLGWSPEKTLTTLSRKKKCP